MFIPLHSLTVTGSNKWGQLGRGDSEDTGDEPDEMGDNLVPLDMGSGETIDDVALGEFFTCAVLDSGMVKVSVWWVYPLPDERRTRCREKRSREREEGYKLGTMLTMKAQFSSNRSRDALITE